MAANDYYDKLTETIPPTDIIEWEEQIKHAEQNRLNDITVMDILGASQPMEGAGRETMEIPTSHGTVQEWIQLAMQIEEKQ